MSWLHGFLLYVWRFYDWVNACHSTILRNNKQWLVNLIGFMLIIRIEQPVLSVSGSPRLTHRLQMEVQMHSLPSYKENYHLPNAKLEVNICVVIFWSYKYLLLTCLLIVLFYWLICSFYITNKCKYNTIKKLPEKRTKANWYMNEFLHKYLCIIKLPYVHIWNVYI